MTTKERIIKLNLSGNIEKAFLLLVDELGGGGNDLSAFLDQAESNAKLSADGNAVRYGDIEVIKEDSNTSGANIKITKRGLGQWANLGFIEQAGRSKLISAYIELFGDSVANWNNNPIPNAIIGKCKGQGAKNVPLNLPIMSFCAIEDEVNYTKVTELKRVLFKWVNGYVDNESLLELYGGLLKVLTDIQLDGQIIDNNGSTGNDGDILTKVGGKVVWKAL